MKSIKPGRGPSGMSFVGSIFAIFFGILWTLMAFGITSGAPFGIIGLIFPLFGVLFVILGIFQAVYHYKNTTGKERFSEYDITDATEEGDPSARWIKKQYSEHNEGNIMGETSIKTKYCPYCGTKLESEFKFCPKCGKEVN